TVEAQSTTSCSLLTNAPPTTEIYTLSLHDALPIYMKMQTKLNHETALEILRKYNSESFHIRHGLTVEGCMKWFAEQLGYGEEKEFWGICGLLHDVDFERY